MTTGITGLEPTGGEALSLLTSADNVSYKASEETASKLLGIEQGATVRLSDILDYVLAYISQNKMTIAANLGTSGASVSIPEKIGVVFDSGAKMTS